MNDRDVVTREVVEAEQFTNFEFDELQEFLVIHHVDLVEGDHDARHVHLAREQDVLSCLWHGAVGRAYHEDSPVHLRGSGDHILDVVGVPGAVYVGVVTFLRLVLHVGDGDRDAAFPFFGGVIDLIKAFDFDVLSGSLQIGEHI